MATKCRLLFSLQEGPLVRQGRHSALVDVGVSAPGSPPQDSFPPSDGSTVLSSGRATPETKPLVVPSRRA